MIDCIIIPEIYLALLGVALFLIGGIISWHVVNSPSIFNSWRQSVLVIAGAIFLAAGASLAVTFGGDLIIKHMPCIVVV